MIKITKGTGLFVKEQAAAKRLRPTQQYIGLILK
jgi:hypothetical protein